MKLLNDFKNLKTKKLANAGSNEIFNMQLKSLFGKSFEEE